MIKTGKIYAGGVFVTGCVLSILNHLVRSSDVWSVGGYLSIMLGLVAWELFSVLDKILKKIDDKQDV